MPERLSSSAPTEDGQGEPAKGSDAFLRENCLPTKDGGGIVFPNGVLGRGFYLEDWVFIRYCTDQMADKQTAEKRKRPMEALILIIFFALIIGALVAADQGWGLPPMFPAVTIVWTGVVVLYLYRRFRPFDDKLMERYPGARPVPYFKHWRARVMMAGACGDRWWLWTHFSTTIFLLSAANSADNSYEREGTSLLNVYALLGLATVEGVFFLALLVTYTYIRQRLGRAPTRADLQPV